MTISDAKHDHTAFLGELDATILNDQGPDAFSRGSVAGIVSGYFSFSVSGQYNFVYQDRCFPLVDRFLSACGDYHNRSDG